MTKPISQFGISNAAFNVSSQSPFGLTATQNSIAPMKLSLSQLTTLRWSLADEAIQVKQTGYDAIGIWRPKLAEFGDAHAAEMLQRAKLSVSSLSFAGGFTGGCGFSYVDAIADCRQAIDQATILGAKQIVVVGGSQNGHTVRHSRRLVVEAMRQLGDFAALAHIKLSLLPMHPFFGKKWTFLNSLDHALDVITEIRHPSVCLAFDAYHLWQEPRLIERIPEIAHLTGIVQLSDSNESPRSDRDRLMPGRGTIPLPSLVQAFQMAGFAGYFDVQVWSGTLWNSNYSHQIEQTHAAVKSMSLRAAVAT